MNAYLVDDRVHVPGKGLGRVSFVKNVETPATVVRFDKAFRYRNGWRRIVTIPNEDIRPWGCGVHSDCRRNQGLAHACILSRVHQAIEHKP